MRSLFRHCLLFLLLAHLLVFAGPAHADQETPTKPEAAPTAVEPLSDPLERETPRSAMTAYVRTIEEGDFELAARYMDLRFMPRHFRTVEGPELSRMLDFVITRRLWIDLGGLSDKPEGDRTDGLPDSREILGVIKIEDESISLYLQRVSSGDGLPVWKISSVTVARIADLYEDLKYSPLVQWFESHVPEGKLIGIEYFKWVITLLTMLVTYPIAYVIGIILTKVLSRKGSPLRPRIRAFFVRPVAILIIFIVGSWVLVELGMGVTAQRIARSNTSLMIVSTWVVLSGVSLFRDCLIVLLKKRGRLAATVLLRPIATSVKAVVVLTATLIWLDNIGYDITTLLAGLGIGGLAIALALQKPFEDLFGAITLFTQQPLHVHDFCKFGGVVGTVEEIGLRSTRVRTLDNTLITVPNARLASEYIENISARGSIRFRAEVRLSYDATADQLRTILDETRSMLENHERLAEDSTRARLIRLGKHGFVIEAIGYVQTTNYGEFLEASEGLNLSITEIVTGAGARFASPLASGDGA